MKDCLERKSRALLLLSRRHDEHCVEWFVISGVRLWKHDRIRRSFKLASTLRYWSRLKMEHLLSPGLAKANDMSVGHRMMLLLLASTVRHHQLCLEAVSRSWCIVETNHYVTDALLVSEMASSPPQDSIRQELNNTFFL